MPMFVPLVLLLIQKSGRFFCKLIKHTVFRGKKKSDLHEFIKVDAFAFLVNEVSEMERQLNISRIPMNLKSRKLLS